MPSLDAYQNFLHFFSTFNRERLEGLSLQHFIDMNLQEKDKAFEYLLRRIEGGGSAETVDGIFLADFQPALPLVTQLMEAGLLNDEAHLAAASNIFSITKDRNLLTIFIRFLASSDVRLREKAAGTVPTHIFSDELKLALEGMIRNETERLAHINAGNALLEYHGITKESLGKKKYLGIYRHLLNEDKAKRELGLQEIDSLFV